MFVHISECFFVKKITLPHKIVDLLRGYQVCQYFFALVHDGLFEVVNSEDKHGVLFDEFGKEFLEVHGCFNGIYLVDEKRALF